MPQLLLLVWLPALLALLSPTEAASCTLTPPLEGASGPQLGLVVVPGAQIPGQLYQPLAEEVQRQLGAQLWLGVTRDWLGSFPNPVEISGAVQDCMSQAASAGLGGPVFLAGHSLGGIMLELFIRDNPDLAAGVVLLGSYLPDLLGDQSNEFPVPVLTAVGGLDGLTLSYVYREWLESSVAEAGQPGRYPVIVVEGVNHGQVASGDIPSFVTEQDIPSELSESDAHQRYATAVAAFITVQQSESFSEEAVELAMKTMGQLQYYTSAFLTPFADASLMESDGAEVGPRSSWMEAGQRELLGATEQELQLLAVRDLVVEFEDLGDAKPGVNISEPCGPVEVTTYSQCQYEFSPADANTLQSAKVMKAKFKLEDSVREALCLPAAPRRQCRDINEAAFKLALDLASEEARNRFEALGTRLVFTEDKQSPWGPGWEYSTGLHYTNINSTHVGLHSTSLISEPDFFIEVAAGMHYCDLLSPYRALEWIYIISVQGKSYTN